MDITAFQLSNPWRTGRNWQVPRKAGPMKQMKISRGYRSFLKKYSPEQAIIINESLWEKERIEGCEVEAVPASVFLMSGKGGQGGWF